MRIKHRCCWTVALLGVLLLATGLAQYVEDSVDVGAGWVGSLAYNSREDVLYGASESGVFFAISCDSNKVIESFLLRYALVVAYDSTDNKAYCSFYNTHTDDSLLVVDGATQARIRSLPMDGATTPVWDPVSDRVYVSCQSTNSVAVVDCVNDSLLTYIPVGACPIKMCINTLRRKLYVLNYDDGTVSIVDMATNQVIKTVATETAGAGYYCRSADKFYCSGPQQQCIVIGGQSDTIVARIPLPGAEGMMSATGNESAGLVYLGTFSGSDDYVATVLAEKDSVVATAMTGRAPWGLTCYEPTGLVYSASSWSDEVYVVSRDGARILTTIQVGDYPFVFAAVPRHNRLYLGHLSSRYVYVIRDTSAGIAEPRLTRLELGGALSATPNPFAQSVVVGWNSVGKGGDVARVYARDGRLVMQAEIPAGRARWVWDGLDSDGHPVPEGVYMAEVGTRRCKLVKAR
jgi:YVTN family beta-propeller protein